MKPEVCHPSGTLFSGEVRGAAPGGLASLRPFTAAEEEVAEAVAHTVEADARAAAAEETLAVASSES